MAPKVNNIDNNRFVNNRFVSKTEYNTDKPYLERKLFDTSGHVKKTDYNARITEIEGKIPHITGLATTAALTGVENKILSVSNFIKKKSRL